MRILQLIDSLDPGGAEKMAVGFANALAKRAEFSGLAATRKEGELKNQLDENVPYLYLDRKRTIDFKALFKLKKYCATNKVTHIQGHGSSFFYAVLLKMLLPSVFVIWHNHNGEINSIEKKKLLLLKFCSFFFNGVIAVNSELKDWSLNELYCKKAIELPNFVSLIKKEQQIASLTGEQGKRIVCVANLRSPKNHMFLVDVAKRLKEENSDWTFHLIGRDYEDTYSKELKFTIAAKGLEKTIFIYGAQNDVQHIIRQGEIAVLTSQTEGLPVALLEYGINAKPVVSTAVGDIPKIIENGQNGFIVHKDDVDGFYKALLSLIGSPFLRRKVGDALCRTVETNYSEAVVIDKMMDWLGRKK